MNIFTFILRWLASKTIGYCPQHGYGYKVKRYRMNTAYVVEEANYANGCKLCQEECYAYYKELWDDYYSGIL